MRGTDHGYPMRLPPRTDARRSSGRRCNSPPPVPRGSGTANSSARRTDIPRDVADVLGRSTERLVITGVLGACLPA
ncbi:hypothetical protein PDJAM_G00194980 [Pangasius djambal]|uniref:Uncharacterized protein n=1 Tax=Pangasius djambal TaxID=1691987 RepID=A0ACC5ZRZ5_9TELE|nr:hypothetical protein [Pangasius djambal]